jgi:hypothetical protein
MSIPTGYHPFPQVNMHPATEQQKAMQNQGQEPPGGGEDIEISDVGNQAFNHVFLTRMGQQFRTSDIVPPLCDIIRSHTTDSVGDVLRRLIQSKIIALPIINTQTVR